VLERPDDRPADARTIPPGNHQFDAYSVVWWDPRWLTLKVKPLSGIRRQELIVKEAPRDVVVERRRAYDSWRTARDAERAAGSAPSIVVQTARERARGESQDHEPAVVVVDLAQRGVERPGGVAFGLLVHGILSQTAFDATRDIVDRVAAAEARVLGLAEADARAGAAIVERVLAHDLLARARAADARGACRRETPVTIVADDGTLVEGVVDLAFEEHGTWTVVDYKTDRELAATGEEQYRRQIALYAAAITAATGRPANGVLVRL